MVFTICNKCLSGNSIGLCQKPGWVLASRASGTIWASVLASECPLKRMESGAALPAWWSHHDSTVSLTQYLCSQRRQGPWWLAPTRTAKEDPCRPALHSKTQARQGTPISEGEKRNLPEASPQRKKERTGGLFPSWKKGNSRLTLIFFKCPRSLLHIFHFKSRDSLVIPWWSSG